MTELLAALLIASGLVNFLQFVARSFDREVMDALRESNRELERINKDQANRLKSYRGQYRPEPGDFDRLQLLKGGRDG